MTIPIKDSLPFWDKVFSVGPDGEPCEGVKAYEVQAHTGGRIYAKGKIHKYNPDHLVIPTPGLSGLFDSRGYLISGAVGKSKGKK